MSGRNWSAQDVADKADSEGGIISLLGWGLRANDIADPVLAAEWAKLEEIMPLLDRIRELLPEPSGEWAGPDEE